MLVKSTSIRLPKDLCRCQRNRESRVSTFAAHTKSSVCLLYVQQNCGNHRKDLGQYCILGYVWWVLFGLLVSEDYGESLWNCNGKTHAFRLTCFYLDPGPSFTWTFLLNVAGDTFMGDFVRWAYGQWRHPIFILQTGEEKRKEGRQPQIFKPCLDDIASLIQLAKVGWTWYDNIQLNDLSVKGLRRSYSLVCTDE